MGALIVHDDVLELIAKRIEKYESLVWYARKHPADHPFWRTVPADIRKGALDAAARVRELYPDETDALACVERGDFEHGFNSGVLAALRYVLTAATDPAEAEEAWPELDTITFQSTLD